MLKFVSEIGVNHLGSENKAIKYCEFLATTQTDAITMQVREMDFYDGSISWKKELTKECYLKCVEIIRDSKKSFGLAVGDLETAKYCKSLKPDFWKVLSWAIIDLSLIKFLVDSGSPVFVSTGMSGIDEIILVAKKFGNKISFIHTQLSVDVEDVNLSAIASIREATGCQVSFGLHCDNIDVMGVSLTFKPESLFFYVKEKSNVNYPDDSYAIQLSNLDITIRRINILAQSIGDGKKNSFVPKTLSTEQLNSLSHISSRNRNF